MWSSGVGSVALCFGGVERVGGVGRVGGVVEREWSVKGGFVVVVGDFECD